MAGEIQPGEIKEGGTYKLWVRYQRASHNRAILKRAFLRETRLTMASESNKQKESLKVEKVSILVLVLCFFVLVYLLTFRPF